MKKLLLIISTIMFFINLNSKSEENTSTEIQIFNNLSSLKIQADESPEYPKIDNKNWLKPNYSSFYKKTTPSGIQYWAYKAMIGIQNNLKNY